MLELFIKKDFKEANIGFYFYIALHLVVYANAYRYLHSVPLSYGYNSGHSALHKYVASISDMPYHVLIAHNNLYCSGSIIRSKVIVTAASCFVRWHIQQRIVVKVGAETITGFGQVIEVLEVKKHEYYSYDNFMDNDIALLMLKEHIIFTNYINKILLIEPEMAIFEGSTLDVSGWGSATIQPNKYANSLLWSEMILLNNNDCRQYHPFLITRSNFCARYLPERRLTDNGGPAVFRELLVGVLSFGASHTEEPFIAVFTNISYFHRWIALNTKRLMSKYCVQNEYYVMEDYEAYNDEDHDGWI